MRDSYQVSIKEPRRGEPAVVEAVNMNVVEREQTATGDRVEPLSIKGIESGQDAKRWKPYEDSKYESPVLNRLVPWPVYYFCRWKILQVFHTRLLFGIVLGEVLVFLLLVVGLAGVLAAMGMNRGEDAAEGTGGVAVIPTALSFAFACRNSLWVLFTGLPFERALFWHKLCAYLSVLTGAWHGYLSNEWNASGLVLTGAMAALCIFALWFIRRHIFEVFYRFHWILFLVVIVASFAHGAGAIAFGAGLWLFDILVRVLITFLNNKHQRSMLAVRLPSNVVRLTFLKKNFNYKSGQYCFICVPGVSFFEWHPFSLSSSPHENTVSLHIRVLGDWTQRLYDYVDRTRQIDVYLDGPYGAPCLDVDGDRYKMFMFVSGGIGITPMQSICNDVLYQRRRGRDIKKVMFIWSVRDLFMVTSVLDYDKEYFQQNTDYRLPISFCPDLVVRGEPQGVMENYFHLTRERDSSKFAEANIRPEIQPDLKFGRPNLPDFFSKMKGYASEQGESRVAVLTCGPTPLVDSAEKLCAKYSGGGVTFDFHKEVFEF